MRASINGKIYLVEEGPNPSTDYFVLPYVQQTTQLIRCTWHELPEPTELAQANVIFIRYVPNGWRQLITTNRQQLGRLIYFMDDDLLDFAASRGLSWRYRYKLLRHATQARSWLQAMQAELWVSSDWLINKYKSYSPTRLVPRPLNSLSVSSSQGAKSQSQVNADNMRRVFYHGSASHHDEIVWLYPVIQEVLKQHKNVTFEIIGGADVNRLYRNLPRVTVIHPMKWPSYRHFIALPGRHIGLAPSLNTPFNQARSYTKVFDITAAGAVGIYAQSGPANAVISHRAEGLLVQMTHSAWIDAIGQLAQHDLSRVQMLIQARALLESLTTGSANTASICNPTELNNANKLVAGSGSMADFFS